MTDTLTGKVLVAQGGGPTAVINQSLAGVVLEARKFSQVTRIYGAIHGVRGIVDEDFLDLTRETSHNLELVAQTPGSALLSTREKGQASAARLRQVADAAEKDLKLMISGAQVLRDMAATLDSIDRFGPNT